LNANGETGGAGAAPSHSRRLGKWWHWLWGRRAQPLHLRRGKLGELAAKRHLQRLGLKFLTANFWGPRGEIDLIFRDGSCLVFVEVKTRSSEDWTRPAAAVNAAKKRRLSRTALAYLRALHGPQDAKSRRRSGNHRPGCGGF
jgi:putative endonuclease